MAAPSASDPRQDLRQRLPPGPPPRVLVASGYAQESRALSHLLQDAGCVVNACEPLDALKCACEQPPEVLFLDGALQWSALSTCVRVLSRNPDTRGVVVVLLAPAGEPTVGQRLRMLDAFCVMMRPLTAERFCRDAGRALQWAGELRDMVGIGRAAGGCASQAVAGCDALLVRPVACPFHDEPVRADRHVLRGGRIAADSDPLDLPIYTHALRGGDFIDFHRASVTVCPRCLFASSRGSDFLDLRDRQAERAVTSLPAEARLAVEQGHATRQTLAGSLATSFYTHARSLDEAIVSHRLAACCHEAIFRSKPDRLAQHGCAAAEAHLTIALLEGQRGSAGAASFRAARELLDEARTLLEDGPLIRPLYQIAALDIRLGDDKTAFVTLQQLEELSRGLCDAKHRAVADRYLHRLKNLWHNRAYHRLAA